MFVLQMMQEFSIGILFFHLIFNIVELIFILISILLIYSLLLIRLETKTLEIGIMRMVGTSKSGLVLMIFL
jgi:ABC-type antimicrobial peptide transport system permease subunit